MAQSHPLFRTHVKDSGKDATSRDKEIQYLQSHLTGEAPVSVSRTGNQRLTSGVQQQRPEMSGQFSEPQAPRGQISEPGIVEASGLVAPRLAARDFGQVGAGFRTALLKSKLEGGGLGARTNDMSFSEDVQGTRGAGPEQSWRTVRLQTPNSKTVESEALARPKFAGEKFHEFQKLLRLNIGTLTDQSALRATATHERPGASFTQSAIQPAQALEAPHLFPRLHEHRLDVVDRSGAKGREFEEVQAGARPFPICKETTPSQFPLQRGDRGYDEAPTARGSTVVRLFETFTSAGSFRSAQDHDQPHARVINHEKPSVSSTSQTFSVQAAEIVDTPIIHRPESSSNTVAEAVDVRRRLIAPELYEASQLPVSRQGPASSFEAVVPAGAARPNLAHHEQLSRPSAPLTVDHSSGWTPKENLNFEGQLPDNPKTSDSGSRPTFQPEKRPTVVLSSRFFAPID